MIVLTSMFTATTPGTAARTSVRLDDAGGVELGRGLRHDGVAARTDRIVPDYELAVATAVHVQLDPGQAACDGRQERAHSVLPVAAPLPGAEAAMTDNRRLSVEDHDRSLVSASRPM